MILLLFLALLSGLGALAADSDKRMTFGDKTIERTVQLRTHSIYAPYIDQDLQNRWWDFGGDAYVNTNKYVRLTRDRPSQMGWLWSRLPLTSGNWVMEVEFKVSGQSTNLFGDGFAIWVTKGRATPGPVFGAPDSWDGLGIFLDTYANSRHAYAFPRITGMLNSGSDSYNYKTDGEKQGVGACSMNFRRTNVATKVKITYIKDTLIDVKLQYKAWDDWTDCFRVNMNGTGLPNAPFVGFSAMTGDVSDNHDIIGVSTFSAILSSRDAKASVQGSKNKTKSETGGWGWSLFKFVMFVGACVGAFFAWKEYKARSGRGGYTGLGGGMGGGMGGGLSMGGGGGMFGSSSGRGGFGGGGMYGGNKRI